MSVSRTVEAMTRNAREQGFVAGMALLLAVQLPSVALAQEPGHRLHS